MKSESEAFRRAEIVGSIMVPINRTGTGATDRAKVQSQQDDDRRVQPLKRLAAAVRFRPRPPCFQALGSALSAVLVPFGSNSLHQLRSVDHLRGLRLRGVFRRQALLNLAVIVTG